MSENIYLHMHVHKYTTERQYSAVIESWAKQTKFFLYQAPSQQINEINIHY